MHRLYGCTQRNTTRAAYVLGMLIILICVMPATRCLSEELPDWTLRIRRDHPRLFFNSDTWPGVRQRALGTEEKWYLSIKRRVDRLAEAAKSIDKL